MSSVEQIQRIPVEPQYVEQRLVVTRRTAGIDQGGIRKYEILVRMPVEIVCDFFHFGRQPDIVLIGQEDDIPRTAANRLFEIFLKTEVSGIAK